jgi:hypothetical protein
MSELKLGQIGRCKITGFTGTIIGRSTWLTGCDQLCLKPKVDKDGKAQESYWIDEGAVEFVDEGINKEKVKSDKPGGPRQYAPKA